MEMIRIGIIGIGNMGTTHSKNIVEGLVPRMELTAIADLKEERRTWASENLKKDIVIFDNAEELINSGVCDAVVIATPHYSHPRLVIMALNAGLHVICEKPAGVYTKDVRKMNEVAKENDKVFAMMFNQRTNHIYRKMHELVHSGVYGKIKRVNLIITDWYRSQAYYDSGGWRATWDGEGGGVLLNQCPHNLDLLQWICGMPEKIQAFCHYGKWHNIEVEDDVTAYMEFPNGATGVFVTSTADAPGTNRFEITLEKARIISENNKLQVYELEMNEREHCFTTTEGFRGPDGSYVEIETDGENLQHIGVFRSFVGNILDGTPLVARGEEGINGLLLSNAMHLSSWTNNPVSIPFDEELFLDLLNDRRKNSIKKEEAKEVVFKTEGTY